MVAQDNYLLLLSLAIQNDNIQNFIIDIRSNQGGNLDQVDTLMKYLTNQPYRHCSVRFARYVVDISSPPERLNVF